MARQIEDPHALLLELMRQDFAVFLRKAFAWIGGGEPIMWNWHLDAISWQLERVAAGDCRRLLVNLPPRNGKSIAISVAWIAWMLGRNPRHRFVCVSYSNDLSFKLARDCLAIMQARWYRELFSRTLISKRSAAYDFETTAGGGRLATSITGTLTGRGGDTIVLDDVIKPQEADSEVIRANVNAWYQSTLSSRLNDKRKGAIICVMQRLHEYDLAGLMMESGRYDVLALPAIAPTDEIIPLTRGRVHHRKLGDILHPEREPRQTLDEMRADMGSEKFSAQYLQAPVPAIGNLIKAHWFKNYDPSTVRHGGGIIVQSIDTANKANPNCAFSVVITALVRGKYVHVLDVYRGRLEFPNLRRKVISLAQEHRAETIIIEEQGSGIGLVQELKPHGAFSVIGRKAEQDKVSRVDGISAMVEAGQLLLPPDAPWLSEFKAEVLAFPNGRFDDQVDALSQLLIWVRQRQALGVPPNAGPIMFVEDDYGFQAFGDDAGIFSGRTYSPESDPWLDI